jgi:hypothetical protein
MHNNASEVPLTGIELGILLLEVNPRDIHFSRDPTSSGLLSLRRRTTIEAAGIGSRLLSLRRRRRRRRRTIEAASIGRRRRTIEAASIGSRLLSLRGRRTRLRIPVGIPNSVTIPVK